MMESAGVHSFIYFLKRHYVFNANCILLENKGIIILERKRNCCYWMYTKFRLDVEQTFDKITPIFPYEVVINSFRITI